MDSVYSHKDSEGTLLLMHHTHLFERAIYDSTRTFKSYTIVWNRGPRQMVTIDGQVYGMDTNMVLPIMMDQAFLFERPQDIVGWQFNREFYCIVNHDAEVGCVGFVFYGPSPTMFVQLMEEDVIKMDDLLQRFIEEFTSEESIKGAMLRTLLVNLIISITRLAKKQYIQQAPIETEKFDSLRQYHLLVEMHFKEQHQVKYYAGLLNKSPKTIANIFSLYSKQTPLQVIQQRIIAEANRLFKYTDKSVKEVATDLGFDDMAHFSKFFKNQTGKSPSSLRSSVSKSQ
jgi:AraC family transcriptional regulator, transcriptional activator of pobA